MPAPSARTKPSRSRSNGRLARGGSSLRVDRARIEAKPPSSMWVMAASLPPVIITSAMPDWIARNASPMALAAEAQAVAIAVFGPRSDVDGNDQPTELPRSERLAWHVGNDARGNRDEPASRPAGAPMIFVKYLDLVILAIALPVFVIAGWPLFGYAAAAFAWLVQRAINDVLTRRAAASDDPKTVAGLIAGSMIGRGWLVALTIFGAYLIAGRDDAVGLSAAVLVVILFTAYFTVSLILRPFENHRELPS